MVLALLTVTASVLMYEIEHPVQPEKFDSVFTGMYWAMTTITTTGYGDLVPVTAAGPRRLLHDAPVNRRGGHSGRHLLSRVRVRVPGSGCARPARCRRVARRLRRARCGRRTGRSGEADRGA
ncbi:MAG: potassium channel family protein [Eggerthellaceae bacterium]